MRYQDIPRGKLKELSNLLVKVRLSKSSYYYVKSSKFDKYQTLREKIRELFKGRLKNEFLYRRDWKNYSIEDFISALYDYLHWYKEEWKKTLGFLSPRDYRQKLRFFA